MGYSISIPLLDNIHRILTVLLYMVCHGSHQYTPSHVSINLPAPAGSVMGYPIGEYIGIPQRIINQAVGMIRSNLRPWGRNLTSLPTYKVVPPFGIAKESLENHRKMWFNGIYSWFMIAFSWGPHNSNNYGLWYANNYGIHGVYKPINITRGHHLAWGCNNLPTYVLIIKSPFTQGSKLVYVHPCSPKCRYIQSSINPHVRWFGYIFLEWLNASLIYLETNRNLSLKAHPVLMVRLVACWNHLTGWLKKKNVNSKIASLFQNESQTSKTYDFINITLPYVNKTYQNVSLLTYDSSIWFPPKSLSKKKCGEPSQNHHPPWFWVYFCL